MGADNVHLEPALETIKAILILDNNGSRILAKYFDTSVLATSVEQKKFEKNLFNKTHKVNGEIIMFEGMICVYRTNVDLFFYVIGSVDENELVLMNQLDSVYNSISQILRKNVDRRNMLENLEIIMLALDEAVDNGIILEADPASVVSRVALRGDDIPLGEQTVAQVLQSAKEQLVWSLLK
ncbi:coatomer subunit zeta-1-like [Eurytemora carolleeae]|uniref:coatomer subunit zeta-1-like n=1 Tax=Eurytemora carolleeae TaxID=1294199 RepID=UPI000C78A8C8|nr:coatomer subunit zeta-1-like [Eurytemora carolleeae]|eukprot:XP_023338420.1 coatomer subunit zeta-1-like [Eurytemora affinis]